jgi:hypothetical protein
MAQIQIPKDQLALTIERIKQDGGYILKSKISNDMKEVVLVYNPGATEKQRELLNQEPVMVAGPEGLKPLEGTILSKPKEVNSLITEEMKSSIQ